VWGGVYNNKQERKLKQMTKTGVLGWLELCRDGKMKMINDQ
jgi:hypothetical protein